MMGKTTTSSREAVEVKQGPVDPSVFALPAGYKKVDPRPEARAARTERPGASPRLHRGARGSPRRARAPRGGRALVSRSRRAAGRDAYLAGHIPGAVVPRRRRGPLGPGRGRGGPLGRHPWPSEQSRSGAFSAPRASAPPTSWWPTTTSRAPSPRGSGTCCARTATSARRCSTAASRSGRPRDDRSRRRSPRPEPRAYRGPPSARASSLDKAEVTAAARGSLLLDARARRALSRRGRAHRSPRRATSRAPRARPSPANLTADAVPVFRPPAELRARYDAPGRGRAGARRLLRLRRDGLPRPPGPAPGRPPRPPLRGLVERVEQRSRAARGHRR